MQWDASENAGFSTGTPWLKPYQTLAIYQEKSASK